MGWLRKLFGRTEPLQWVISTPYSTMSGEGLPPMDVVADLRQAGIPVEVLSNAPSGREKARR